MKKLLLVALMTVLSFGAVAGDWKKLGQRRVSFGADHDVIHVSGFKGKYDSIAFKVEDAPIFMRKVKVIFGNGRHQTFYINKRWSRGKRSLPYRLLEGDRVINKVELDYKTAGGAYRSAEVKLYGKRS